MSPVYLTVFNLCASKGNHSTSSVKTLKLICFLIEERSPTVVIFTFNSRVRLTIKMPWQTELLFLFFSFVVCLVSVLSRHHLVLKVTLCQFLLFARQFQLKFSVLFFCLLDLDSKLEFFLFILLLVKLRFFTRLFQFILENFFPLFKLLFQVGLVKLLCGNLLLLFNVLILQVLVLLAELFDFLDVFLQLAGKSLVRFQMLILLALLLFVRIKDELFLKQACVTKHQVTFLPVLALHSPPCAHWWCLSTHGLLSEAPRYLFPSSLCFVHKFSVATCSSLFLPTNRLNQT